MNTFIRQNTGGKDTQRQIYTTCINNITEYDSNVARPPVRPSVRYMLRNELTEHEAHDNDTLVV